MQQDLNLEFGRGITVLLGPNGAGKTTLIEGLLDPKNLLSQSVVVDGFGVDSATELTRLYATVGHMPQQWKYFSPFTARECVEYAGWMKGIRSSGLREAAAAALTWVQLSEHAETKVRRLSGGMRQRVGLAEAFVNRPRVALLDEPTVGLDPAQRTAFRQFLLSKAPETSIVVSTHLTDDVEVLADRVIVLTERGVAFDGLPSALAARAPSQHDGASKLEAGYLAVSTPAPGTVP